MATLKIKTAFDVNGLKNLDDLCASVNDVVKHHERCRNVTIEKYLTENLPFFLALPKKSVSTVDNTAEVAAAWATDRFNCISIVPFVTEDIGVVEVTNHGGDCLVRDNGRRFYFKTAEARQEFEKRFVGAPDRLVPINFTPDFSQTFGRDVNDPEAKKWVVDVQRRIFIKSLIDDELRDHHRILISTGERPEQRAQKEQAKKWLASQSSIAHQLVVSDEGEHLCLRNMDQWEFYTIWLYQGGNTKDFHFYVRDDVTAVEFKMRFG